MNKNSYQNLVSLPALLLVVFFPLTGMAMEEHATNGHDLLRRCQVAVEYMNNGETTNDIESVRFCDDYLMGFREAENVKRIYMPGHYHTGYCFPNSGVSNGEAARVVVNYLKTHEYELDAPANDLIRDALIDGFPCSN